ncbi:MAG TPA: putative cytokinetic ring protein SteA [Mycobacteriales bacterium]|nr:putative cytokinetic ring protein SteA [Mycobacteriales bacterium]HWB67560.1 putative cytokinetic ring protein SteA [Mycobacteriales bacterium]
MRLATLRRARAGELPPGVVGPVRLDRRTKDLSRRIRPGDIAVIDHIDLDLVGAEALVAGGVGAVVNVAPSVSGRYPNLGPEALIEAGIPLIDNVGSDAFSRLREGDVVRIEDDKVLDLDGLILVQGTRQTAESVAASMVDARAGLASQLEAFASNTMEYLRRERDLLLDGIGVPDLRTQLDGRHVLVVVRGYHYREDLIALRHYVREYKPVLIGVDGGADALLEEGLRPHVIVGDMDSVSDTALKCGAEIVVHAYRDGSAPGLARVQELGVEPVVFPAAGTSEDVALLLADEGGAALIVAVGTHATLVEFLDKGRAGMASTFLTRLRVGGKLIDAKGVSRLYRARIPASALVLLVLATAVAFLVALYVTPGGSLYREYFATDWDHFTRWLHGLL